MIQYPVSAQIADDWEVLNILIPLHCKQENPVILDTTYNTGKMWKKCSYKPTITMDINPKYNPTITGDFKNIPLDANSVDIMVFDPPHLPSDADTDGSSKIYKETYGVDNTDVLRDGNNISKIFEPFLREARRILKPKGIVLAKLCDFIHSGEYQFSHVDFIILAKSLGLIVDDLFIKIRKTPPLISSKWKNVLHLRKNFSYWIVVKKK